MHRKSIFVRSIETKMAAGWVRNWRHDLRSRGTNLEYLIIFLWLFLRFFEDETDLKTILNYLPSENKLDDTGEVAL